MKHLLSLLAVAAWAIFAQAVSFAAFPLAYVGEPDLIDVSLSPDGAAVVTLQKDYVYKGGRESWHKIEVRDLTANKIRLKHQVEGRIYFEVTWVSDTTILARGRQFTFKKRKTYAEELLVSINPIEGTYKTLFSMPRVKKREDIKPFKLHQFSAHNEKVAISYPVKKKVQLALITVSNSKISLLDEGPETTDYWLLDDELNPHMRIDVGITENIRHYYKRVYNGEWERVHTIDMVDTEHQEIRISNDGETILVLARPEKAETRGIHTFNIATKTYTDAGFSHPQYDLSGVKMGTFGDEKLYAAWWENGLERHWFNPEMKALSDALETRLEPDDNWYIIETNSDQTTWLIYVSAPAKPGTYSVWDGLTKALYTIDDVRPELNDSNLSTRQRIDYTAQDGLTLTGYFTPSLRNPDSASLVVIPHGGPVSRDRMDWDGWAQFLAFRGYHVFQPNFRGSGGYGRTFEFKGHGQWGQAMQTDIEDGVEALFDRKLASPYADRAIIGASYGGYAALMAAVKTPHTYRCVGSINGVSNILSFLDYYDLNDPIEAHTRSVWVKRIGNPKTQQRMLEAISPALNADKIFAKIMLIHGTHDEIVPIAQSVEMRDAAEAANVSVMFKRLPGVRHSYWNDTVNTTVLADIDTFLMRCLPRTWQPQ